jgi:hypothetical protein
LSNAEKPDLNRLKARATELLPWDAPTTLYELVNLRQDASNILLGWGPHYRDIRQEIEALDFEPHAPASDKNRPIMPDTMPNLPHGWSKEQLGHYLSSQVERYIRLIEAAQRLKKSDPVGEAPGRVVQPSPNTGSQRQKVMRRAARRRAPRNRTVATTPSESRARKVAKIIRELDMLRSQLRSESDYDRLRKQNPHFLTFKVGRRNEELREKVLNIQDHRRHIRLAQELAAADSGRKLSTVQTDWKKHKPRKYRQAVQE